MAQQSFLWTALPNGFTPDSSGLRVSVLLSPRLEPQNLAPQLSSFFPEWRDWPATLAKAKFRISYGGASVAIAATQIAGANRVDDTFGLPDSHCWQALFLDTVPVNSYQYRDLSNNG